MEKRVDVYRQVTDKIIAELEKGAAPWVKDWSGTASSDMPRNAITSRAYSGVNILLLWIETAIHGYHSPRWLTFKQCAALGGRVRKNEKGTHITFFMVLEKENENGDAVKIPVMRGYTVFNVEQCENLPEKYLENAYIQPVSDDNDSHMWEFLKSTGAKYSFGGDRACYIPAFDEIKMPDRKSFKSCASFWATFCHELTHWTGHEARLNRKFGTRFGDENYAFEELIAELGAAFSCAVLGVENSQLRHAGHIASWLKVLRADKRAIFTAASAATKAANLLTKSYSAESEDLAEAA